MSDTKEVGRASVEYLDKFGAPLGMLVAELDPECRYKIWKERIARYPDGSIKLEPRTVLIVCRVDDK